MKRWFGLLLLLVSPAALADNIFQIAPYDQSRLYLNLIFGSVANVLPGGGSQLLKTGIIDFNSAILVLGGIVIIYSLLVSTINTSHDGEMLGKRWNSVWIPLRSAGGFALLIPVKTAGVGGYALIQVFVMYIILQGVGAADYVWDHAIKVLISGGGQVQSTTSSGAYEAASLMFQDWVCAYEAAQLQSQTTGNTVSVTSQIVDNKILIGFQGAKPGICGGVDLQDVSTAGPGASIAQQVNEASETMAQLTKTAAQDYVAEYPDEENAPEIKNILQDAASGYTATVQTLANAAGAAALQKYIQQQEASSGGGQWWQNLPGGNMTSTEQLVAYSEAVGWFYAGALYLNMAKATDVSVDLTIKGPTVATADIQAVESLLTSADKSTFNDVIQDAQKFSSPTNIDPNFHFNFPQGPSGIDEIFYYAFMPAWSEWKSYLSNMFTTIPDMMKGNFTVNPILSIQSLGHEIITNVEEYWIAYSAILFGISLAGSILACENPFPYAISATLQYIMPFVTASSLLLFPAAAVMAYYVPFIPAVIFTMGAIGWLIMCIEAMIAAPIVALGILHPEGQHEVFGKSEPGIFLLINIFLRPGLMILGFLAAYVLSYIAIGAFNIVYTIFLGDQNTSSVSIMGTSISLNIYAFLLVSIVQRSFSVIHIVPDRVMRWIGHQDQLASELSGSQELQGLRSSVEGAGSKYGQAAVDAPQAAGEEAGRGIMSSMDAKDKQSDAGGRKGDLSGGGGGEGGGIGAE